MDDGRWVLAPDFHSGFLRWYSRLWAQRSFVSRSISPSSVVRGLGLILMAITAEKISVDVGEQESVTALLYAAAKRQRAGTTVLLGHGAGANQLSGFMRLFAAGLAARGLDTMTFNFLYSERGRG